jgi:hypothetical protein
LIPSCAFVFISWGRVYFCSPIPFLCALCRSGIAF